MDDKRILNLVRAAAEREELEAAMEERASRARHEADGGRSARRWVKIAAPLLAAAALVVLLFLPRSVAIEEATVSRTAVRATNGDVEVAVTLSRPGFLRLVLVDDRNERWVLPIRQRSQYVAKVDERTVLRIPPEPPAAEGAGPGAPRYLLIIASEGVAPNADDLLRDICDPVAPRGAPDAAVRTALEGLRNELIGSYRCAAEVRTVPP